jgi:hypothetical protein
MKVMLGYCWLKITTMAARPSASPGPTHHENTSTSVLAGTFVGATVGGTAVGGTAVGGTEVAGATVGVVTGPQAERIVAAIIKKATSTYKFFLNILSSPFENR